MMVIWVTMTERVVTTKRRGLGIQINQGRINEPDGDVSSSDST
jgi:hypothetical protein